MLHKLLNKRVKNRILGRDEIYSISFANTKSSWRRAKMFEKLNSGNGLDMVFIVSGKEGKARGNLVLKTVIINADEFTNTLTSINTLSLQGITEEFKEIIKIFASQIASYISNNKNLRLEDHDLLFLGNNLVGAKFEIPIPTNAKTLTKHMAGMILGNNFVLAVYLQAFTENREEIATALVDFDEVLSSLVINKRIISFEKKIGTVDIIKKSASAINNLPAGTGPIADFFNKDLKDFFGGYH